MDLADCYRLLGLRTGASYEEIKASYRRLARQYHPDANPTNQQRAKDKFIQLTEAYKVLIVAAQPTENATPAQPTLNKPARDWTAAKAPQVKVTRTPPIQTQNLSAVEQNLKAESYQRLQQLLQQQRFPLAVTVVEGLAERLPHDTEVRQWQAITYQRFGRYFVNQRQSDKARVYLKKALRTDPHNKSLWYEVERDFRRIEQIEIY
jgi:tetratricopeptide (TPR) repeat protein